MTEAEVQQGLVDAAKAAGWCSEDECERDAVKRGWCIMHYQRRQRAGTLPARPSSLERFWAKVDLTDDCWLWLASVDSCGYGRIRVDGELVIAHRFAYELLVGPVPDDLELDHLCMVRRCVRPEHLEPVTHQENCQRAHDARRLAR